MRKKLLVASVFSLFQVVAFAQDYWQQEVNYKIEVKLDDVNHVIRATETLEYINNSPDELNAIYMHIWPNAYRDGKTALAKQLHKNGDDVLTFAKEEEKGGIDSLDFKVNGAAVKWEYHPDHKDMCVIYLNSPLKSGERIQISTPFKVKIPTGKISRLGHIDQSYQITQWYPKPAVYDKNGWNWMPYLTQGEFYSEYGSFDVSITLPANYVVGATGDLQTPNELEFLNELAEKTAKKVADNAYTGSKKDQTPFPVSSSNWKTIRYTQSKVHDFAWFADKRFDVLKGEVELPHSKRKVTTWAMFVPQNGKLWKNAIEYINDGTFYYSKWNGDYPYNQVTAVDGTISAGGGMEYPNVTVIGNCNSAIELEIVIVHEVGHNWFYGILGSNERVHGWMDEGLNTLNEMRYIQTKYPNNKQFSDMVLNGKFHLNDLDHHDSGDISYRGIAMLGEDQPIETHSADFSSINYGIIMYQKTGLVFLYLKDYLGEERFEKAMSAYFEAYKFKHPQPEDMQRVLETTSGKKLSWLFQEIIPTTNHIDYKLKKVKINNSGTEVTVKNIGQVDGPINVSALKNGEVVETIWVEPGQKKTTVQLQTKEVEQVRIDPALNIPELDRTNNNWKADQLFKKIEPLKFEFLFGDHEATKSNNFWTPALAYNSNDKWMLGVAVHNYGIPFKKFQYLAMPMYSIGRKSISGTGEFSFTFLPKKNIKLTRVGMSVRSFKNENTLRGNDSHYNALMPYVYMKLGNRKGNVPFSHNLLFQTIYKNERFAPSTSDHVGGYIKYAANLNYPDQKAAIILRTDFMGNARKDVIHHSMLRSSIEASYKYKYLKKKGCWIEVRGFVGGFWKNKIMDSRYDYSLAGANGAQDVFLEEYFFDRSFNATGSNTQRMDNMGGFKNSGNLALTSNEWMTAGNMYIQLPLKPGIFGVFADFGGIQRGNTFYGDYFNTGIGVRLGDVFGIYFPVYMSQSLDATYGNAKYGEKIRVSLKLNFMNKPFGLSSIL